MHKIVFSKGELADYEPLLEADHLQLREESQRGDPESSRTGRSSAGVGGGRRSRAFEDEESGEYERSDMLKSLFSKQVPSRSRRPASARWNATAVLPSRPENLINFANISYVILCGWWLALGYLLVSVLLYMTVVGKNYGWHCLRMARYLIWPFGSYLSRVSPKGPTQPTTISRIGFGFWVVFFAPVLGLLHLLASALFWVLTPFIPMSKINIVCAALLFESPLTVKVGGGGPPVQNEVLLCVYSAASLYYFRYIVGGLNVVFFNLLLLAPVTIGVSYGLGHSFREENATLVMLLSLLSIIPLANMIGVAISSISARISFAFGAILNAAFGSTIEIFIFLFTMPKLENAGSFVRKALMGSMLADLLLMSSLSMIFGGLKHKEQKFNRQAAGISSVLLIVAISGVFAPTLLYKLYGNQTIDQTKDHVYMHYVVPLSLMIATVLPLIYICGLVFSLKTHSYLVEKKHDLDEETAGAHDEGEEAPEWSMSRSIGTLTICTTCVALLAETLSEVLQIALGQIGIPVAFAGITVIAWVPALCEYINSIVFAMQNNVSLSLSIATSSALQVGMIQLPMLIWMQLLLPYTGFWPENVFRPVFGEIDAVSMLMAVLLTNYLSNDGRSNYLEGAAMLTVYVIIISINYCSSHLEDSSI